MRCDQSSEKDISVAFETLSIISSDLSSQTKNNNENRPPLQSKILSAMHKIRKSKNRADVDVITKKKKKRIKPVPQVLMKAALRSIYLNY